MKQKFICVSFYKFFDTQMHLCIFDETKDVTICNLSSYGS